jgi:hypothetical protein
MAALGVSGSRSAIRHSGWDSSLYLHVTSRNCSAVRESPLRRIDAGDLVTFLFDLFVERRNLVALGLNFADSMALLTERIHLPADFSE